VFLIGQPIKWYENVNDQQIELVSVISVENRIKPNTQTSIFLFYKFINILVKIQRKNVL